MKEGVAMGENIFAREFLGKENSEGFNFPISQEKINLIIEKKLKLQNQDLKARLGCCYYLITLTLLYFILTMLGINLLAILNPLFITTLLMLGIIPFGKKRVSKWTFGYIDFLLKRNEQLLKNNFNQQQLLWSQMLF